MKRKIKAELKLFKLNKVHIRFVVLTVDRYVKFKTTTIVYNLTLSNVTTYTKNTKNYQTRLPYF